MLIQADARWIPLADESVQTVVTSPPYWGLRDYGIEPSVWDREGNCDHMWGEESVKKSRPDTASGIAGTPRPGNDYDASQGSFCQICGAWRGVLGLEPTPDLYVSHMVQIFREVRRVLRKDGTLWLNLGSSYAASPPGNTTKGVSDRSTLHGVDSDRYRTTLSQSVQTKQNTISPGYKPKDLIPIPWLVALALQADGWYLRRDIIWHKPNPMPESVTDRPTTAHEYLFLLSKAAKYHYDADAIREPHVMRPQRRPNGRPIDQTPRPHPKQGWSTSKRTDRLVDGNPKGRNKRSVWTVATHPYPESHFATFAPKLIEPCILAGAPVGGIVLDPFVGSGTTVMVAEQHSRVGIGLDLKYFEQSKKRTRVIQRNLLTSLRPASAPPADA